VGTGIADGNEDEIGHLAAAFDDALARLTGALERERLFTSVSATNCAHR
jgi:hypothetical protein